MVPIPPRKATTRLAMPFTETLLPASVVKNNFGNDIPIYDLERTICDLVRNRSQFEIQDFNNALKTYVSKSDKDLNKLMKYAKLFKIDKIIRQYMEVLM